MAFSPDLDPRFLLARPDLAEQALEGLIPAARYQPTHPRRCRFGFAPITDEAGDAVAEILLGEIFDVLEEVDGRCWGRARRDGSVGHVERDLLGPAGPAPTHRIGNTDDALPMNALVTAADGASAGTLADFLAFDTDLAVPAERQLGGRYRRGGRTRAGVDAAGLVQQALFACGRPGPRPFDLQAALGRAVDTPRRGDLVIWPDRHAGVFIDADQIVHACPDADRVVIEQFAQADARWRATGAADAVIRRL